MERVCAFAATAALALLAAGCVNVVSDADLTLSSDSTVSGSTSMLVSWDAEALAEEGENPDDVGWMMTADEVADFQQIFTGGGVDSISISYVSGDSPLEPHGFEFTFEDVTFEEFNGMMDLMNEDDEWFLNLRLTSDGERHTVEGQSGFPSSSVGDMETLVSEVASEVTVTFVGDVDETNGQADGNVANWSQTGTIFATAPVEAHSTNVMFVAGGMVLVVVVVGSVFGAMVVGRSRERDADV